MKPAYVLLMAFFAALSSCGSYRSIKIDTYNPAAITFPPEVKTVMIVNNAAQQPDGIGHRHMLNVTKLDVLFKGSVGSDSLVSVSSDSTAYTFCLSLGNKIAESMLFHDVRLCGDTLRRDSVFYDVRPFSADMVRDMCDDYGVDALITLDKIFFNTAFYEGNIFVERAIDVKISGELRALWPGQERAYTVPFVDSLTLYWNDLLSDDGRYVAQADYGAEYAMLQLSEATAHDAYVNFVPHWSEDKRWYYTSISSEWKRGSVFAAANKWAEAASIWRQLLLKTTKPRQRARLLSNLALCSEMTDDLEKAVSYAEKASLLYQEFAGSDDTSTILQKLYLDVLKKRTESDKRLSIQLREAQQSDQ